MKIKSLELFTTQQENARLREELRRATNAEQRLRRYITREVTPAFKTQLALRNEIITLKRRIKRLTIDPEKVVEKMRDHTVWLDYCFEDDDFQAGREITIAVLKAAGVKCR